MIETYNLISLVVLTEVIMRKGEEVVKIIKTKDEG